MNFIMLCWLMSGGETMSELKSRKRNRLAGYDYGRAGTYFVTICAKGMRPLFGDVVGATCGRPHVRLSQIGSIVDAEISRISDAYDDVWVDYYIVMPNHVHMIIRSLRTAGDRRSPLQFRVLFSNGRGT